MASLLAGVGQLSQLAELWLPVQAAADKQEQLADILAGYSSSGLPTPDDDYHRDQQQQQQPDDTTEEDVMTSLYSLEHSWTELVRDHEALDKRQRDYQEAVWELLSTELDHISKLRVVVDVTRHRFLLHPQSTAVAPLPPAARLPCRFRL